MTTRSASREDRLPYQREADAVITDWRAVELDLRVVPNGTPEACRLHAEVALLRDEHQRLVEEAIRHEQILRPFPTQA